MCVHPVVSRAGRMLIDAVRWGRGPRDPSPDPGPGLDHAPRAAARREPLDLRTRPATERRQASAPVAAEPQPELLMNASANDRRGFFREAFTRLVREVATRTEQRVAPRRYFRPPGAADEIAV